MSPAALRVANRRPCAAAPPKTVNVADFGATGNGLGDDTAAIQRANNAVAIGGGRVVFPPGVFHAYGVKQDSCVEFFAGGRTTIVHPDGLSPDHVIKGRVVSTPGSIGRRSRVLHVRSTKGMRPGVVVGIQGAGGRSRIQRMALSVDVPPYVNSISLRSTRGLNTKWRNFLFLENEVISYRGITGKSLNNVRRGLFGTEQAHHKAGSVVAQAQRMYAVVVELKENRVVLDRLSWASIRNANVLVGSVGMKITGLVIDGKRQASGSPDTNPFPLKYDLARWVAIRGSTIRNGDHGGVSLDAGTRDSLIEGNTLSDHGDPVHRLGAAIWLFHGATKNVVRGNTINGYTFIGVMVDDRSVQSSEWDADSSRNTITGNTINITAYGGTALNAGVLITGSSSNLVVNNEIGHASTGIMVARDSQGTFASPAVLNRVLSNVFVGHQVGIVVSGSDNEFVRNLLRNVQRPTDNSGRRNRFIDNTVEA